MLLTVAAIQMSCDADREVNLNRAVDLTREAADKGANIVLLPELFLTPYVCKDVDSAHLDLAQSYRGHPALARLSALAADLGVVLPVSFFERAGPTAFNSVCVIDADGADLGLYRAAHLADGPGQHQKYYFSAGDTGFKVWDTLFGRIGVGLGWDQWYGEAARAMCLMGAELLLFPTAMGVDAHEGEYEDQDAWRRAIQGHAAMNCTPVAAANRVGREDGATRAVTFTGGSLVCDAAGAVVGALDAETEGAALGRVDLAASERRRRALGLFRDRRADLYGVLLTLDGGAAAAPIAAPVSAEEEDEIVADLISGAGESVDALADLEAELGLARGLELGDDIALADDADYVAGDAADGIDAPVETAEEAEPTLDPLFTTPSRG